VRDTRSVSPIPVDEERAPADRGLDRAGERRAGLGHAEGSGYGNLLREQRTRGFIVDVIDLTEILIVGKSRIIASRRTPERRLADASA